MKVCTNCNIEKHFHEFYSWKAKRENKILYRNECISCFRDKNTESVRKFRLNKKLSQIKPESQPEVLQIEQLELIEGKTKKCTICDEIMLIDKFKNSNGRSTGNKCHICLLKLNKKIEKQKILENGGGYDYYQEPGKWYNDTQKEAVSIILLSIGWKFNEEKNIWFKEGIKNFEGVFINVVPFVKKEPIYKKRINGAYKRLISIKTPENLNHMIKLRNEGYTYPQLAIKYGVSKTTIRKWIEKIK